MVKIIKCIVDVDNNFIYKNIIYKISDEVKQYKVSDSGVDMDEVNIIERGKSINNIRCKHGKKLIEIYKFSIKYIPRGLTYLARKVRNDMFLVWI